MKKPARYPGVLFVSDDGLVRTSYTEYHGGEPRVVSPPPRRDAALTCHHPHLTSTC